MKFKQKIFLKARKRAQELLDSMPDALPIKALVICEKCGKPLYTNGLQKKCLDMINDGLKKSPYQDDKDLLVKLIGLCLRCTVEHPEMWPYIPRKEKKMIKLALKFGG